jgi:glucose/arabinose dehydrogenase
MKIQGVGKRLLCVKIDSIWYAYAIAALILSFAGLPVVAGITPPDFVEETIDGDWNQVVGLQFAPDGRLYTWEKGGRVWTVDDGVKSPVPFVDISAEVGNWGDYGLLGFTLHADFINNGHVYLLYVVDRHHLLECNEANTGVGEPVCSSAYDSNADHYFAATIGRLTRYTAIMPTGETDFRNATRVDYTSRKVLVGEAIDNGIPILHTSHGVGTLVFGADNSLLVTAGDGTSFLTVDAGSESGTYWEDGLADGIITEKENVGAYRSQLVDSLSGKILRIHPETGDGLPSNPFYDAHNPRRPRSRVWALGLRNPFRMTLRPDTGSHVQADGDPGVLYIGDVGWKI